MARVLRGRERELTVLRESLARGRRGEATALALVGEAGMGKSALLRALGSEAAATGWRVLATAGEEFGRHIPYRCIAELVSGLPRVPNDERRAIVEHQAVPSGLDITPLVFHSALLEILSDVADAQPLAMLIDDAAWLDDASSSAIAFVLRRLHREKWPCSSPTAAQRSPGGHP